MLIINIWLVLLIITISVIIYGSEDEKETIELMDRELRLNKFN